MVRPKCTAAHYSQLHSAHCDKHFVKLKGLTQIRMILMMMMMENVHSFITFRRLGSLSIPSGANQGPKFSAPGQWGGSIFHRNKWCQPIFFGGAEALVKLTSAKFVYRFLIFTKDWGRRQIKRHFRDKIEIAVTQIGKSKCLHWCENMSVNEVKVSKAIFLVSLLLELCLGIQVFFNKAEEHLLVLKESSWNV